jgi:hypothetical protein
MEQLVLNEDTVKRIKNDPVLFGKVAATLDMSIRTLSDLLPSNPPRIATASVLRILREHLNVTKDSDLLTELQPPALSPKKIRGSRTKQVA